MNELKDVKQEQNPQRRIFCLKILYLFAKTKPTKKDPIIEIIKLLFISNLKNVPKYEAAIIKI
tara:strand:+ start:527 stop:715 length:189 start_codon:yes stop_codon:yes gene_type:complete